MKPPKAKSIAAALIALCLIGGIWLCASPMLTAKRFIARHGEEIEQSYLEGDIILRRNPGELGVKHFNQWPAEHDMVEFVLRPSFIGYKGCYYSPDDVPLPFQNTDVPLIPDGEGRWNWRAEGDNRGTTVKIKDNWYYFDASF